ncbi:hypothetical protein, partial [Streptomyces sp. NPDC005548]|uniref:hypothetical protein n=1 Tax=Streptomyces sp. NPDC005548 TaxID=3364724 RepID=UPI0036BC6D25
DAPDLTALDDRQYDDLVVSQVSPRHRDAAVWEQLTNPDNIDRTRTALTNANQRTAIALRRRKTERDDFQRECFARGEAGKREWFGSRADYEKWRRGAANFHQLVLAAISELGKIQKTHNRASNRQYGNEAREALRKLSVAVRRHQAAHAKSGTIAEQEDYELWQLLDRLTVPCGPNQEATTLRTMLDFYWTDVIPVADGEEQRVAAERAMRSAPAGRSGEYSGVPRARHVGNRKDLAS